jgi:hypothetical protein
VFAAAMVSVQTVIWPAGTMATERRDRVDDFFGALHHGKLVASSAAKRTVAFTQLRYEAKLLMDLMLL